MASQGKWRFCNQCQALFVLGKGPSSCPATGAAHVAQGLTFLPAGRQKETDHRQDGWTRCDKCAVIFYLGHVRDDITDDDDDLAGACAAGGQHHRAGYEEESFTGPGGLENHVLRKPSYSLAFDVPDTNGSQSGWRRCRKCRTLVFDGLEAKGRCPGGGGHDNYNGPTHKNFSLAFLLPEVFAGVLTDDGPEPYFWISGRRFADDSTVTWSVDYWSEGSPSRTRGRTSDKVARTDTLGGFEERLRLTQTNAGNSFEGFDFDFFVMATDDATGLTARTESQHYTGPWPE